MAVHVITIPQGLKVDDYIYMDTTENLPYVGMKIMAQNAGCWTQFPEEPTSGSE